MKNTINILLSVYIVLISVVMLLTCTAVLMFLPIDMAVVLVILSAAAFINAIAVAIMIDYGNGEYECKKCGRKFKPSLMAYLFGMHTLTKRYLKCPNCGERSFCKRKFVECK